jgi:ribosome maturation factor RimP
MDHQKNTVLSRVDELAGPVLAEHQAELVDLQFVHEHGQWVLRFFLDKAGGITLDECASISEHFGRIFDAADPIPQQYVLEVSSPGLNRALHNEKDFSRFAGERVDVKMFAPINGRRNFKGRIDSVHEGMVDIKDETEQLHSLPIEGIARARLDPEIDI